MQIIRGKIPCAKKVTIYGPEGIGKSTFASQFPDPVFIDTEGSTSAMDVARFPKASSWQMLLDQVDHVRIHPEICQTLVIDTIDWAEAMCVESVCARNHKNGIEEFGYGNGYVYVKEELGRFLNKLSEVVEAGTNVVLTAHAQIRKFEQPDELGSYDRYELKLGQKTKSQTSPLIKEWADMLLFANYKTFAVSVDDKGKKHKAQGGSRVMYTTHHPCWDAKNRYGLPDEVPFDYESIRHIIEGSVAPVQPIVQEAVPQITKPAPTPVMNNQPEPKATLVQQTMDITTTPTAPPPASEGGRDPDGMSLLPDPRIPKALRDLMIEHNVCDWDIQNVVYAKGHFPADTEVWQYPQDYIDGVLVGAWGQVYEKIKEMKEKEEIPFN